MKRLKGFLSIDFGEAFLKVVYMEREDPDNYRLCSYDLKKVLGTPENKRSMSVDFINHFLKTNNIAHKDVYLTISHPEFLVIRRLSLPAVPKEEIWEAAKWQLKEEAHFDLEDAFFDWQSVKEYSDEEGAKKNEIMFILAQKKAIEEYLAIVFACGLNPLGITSGPFNHSYILKYLKEKPPVQAVLDIGYRDTTLSIYQQNKLNFIRRLPFSSDKLTQSLTSTLVSDAGKMELSYEEAEDFKNTFGIPHDESVVLKNNIHASQVISLIRTLLEGLAREIRRSFDYFTANFKESSPPVLYLAGGGANLKNLDRYLTGELNLRVEKLAFPSCVRTQKFNAEHQLDKDRYQLLSALGAVLKGQEGINLLPPEIKTKKKEFIRIASLRLTALTIGSIFLLSLFLVKFQVRDYKNRLKIAQAHLAALKDIETLRHKISLRQGLVDKIQKDRVPIEGLLRLISAKVRREIVLEELIFNQSSYSLILKGAVLLSSDVAQPVLTGFMQELEASPFFTEVTLISSRGIGQEQKFEMRCDLAH